MIPDKQTILVVEDEPLIRMHGADILENAGYAVIEAGDADEALAIMSNHDQVVLLFSDIDMPGSMDGLALADVVHLRWPMVRLLLTSGHRNIDENLLPDHGRFVHKPWTATMLVEKIHLAMTVDG